MQKRIRISGSPYWVGVYNDEPGRWFVVGEVRGELIQAVGGSDEHAIKEWREHAEARHSAPFLGSCPSMKSGQPSKYR